MIDCIIEHPKIKISNYQHSLDQLPPQSEVQRCVKLLAGVRSARSHLVGIKPDGTFCTLDVHRFYSLCATPWFNPQAFSKAMHARDAASNFALLEANLGNLLHKLDLRFSEPTATASLVANFERTHALSYLAYANFTESEAKGIAQISIHDHESPASCTLCQNDSNTQYGKLTSPPKSLTPINLERLFDASLKKTTIAAYAPVVSSIEENASPPSAVSTQTTLYDTDFNVIDESSIIMPTTTTTVNKNLHAQPKSQQDLESVIIDQILEHYFERGYTPEGMGREQISLSSGISHPLYAQEFTNWMTNDLCSDSNISPSLHSFLDGKSLNEKERLAQKIHSKLESGDFSHPAFQRSQAPQSLQQEQALRSEGTQTPLPNLGGLLPYLAFTDTDIIYIRDERYINDQSKLHYPHLIDQSDPTRLIVAPRILEHLDFRTITTTKLVTPHLYTAQHPDLAKSYYKLNMAYVHLKPFDESLTDLKPILCLAGVGGTSGNFAADFMNGLREQGYTVIIPDRRNEGLSSKEHNLPKHPNEPIPWVLEDLGMDYFNLIHAIKDSFRADRKHLFNELNDKLSQDDPSTTDKTKQEILLLKEEISLLEQKISAYNAIHVFASCQSGWESLGALFRLSSTYPNIRLPVSKIILLGTSATDPDVYSSVPSDLHVSKLLTLRRPNVPFSADKAAMNLEIWFNCRRPYNGPVPHLRDATFFGSVAFDMLMKSRMIPKSINHYYFNTVRAGYVPFPEIRKYAETGAYMHKSLDRFLLNTEVALGAKARKFYRAVESLSAPCKAQKIPCFVLHPQNDIMYSLIAAKDLAEKVGTHHLYELYNAGHMSHYVAGQYGTNAILDILSQVNETDTDKLLDTNFNLGVKKGFYRHIPESGRGISYVTDFFHALSLPFIFIKNVAVSTPQLFTSRAVSSSMRNFALSITNRAST